MRKINLVLLIGLFTLASCGGTGGKKPAYDPFKASPEALSFIKKMNKKFSEIPVNFGGLKVSFVRHGLKESKYLIIKNEMSTGPDAPNSFGSISYTAIDMTNYKEDIPLDELDYKSYDNLSFNSTDSTYIHEQSGMIFEETEATSKDLEKVGAFIQDYKNELVADAIGAEFGLSEERSYDVARLVTNWQRLESKREMTKSDMNLFTNELFGSDFSDVENSLKEYLSGSEESLDKLTEKAASINDISPEHMSEIISELLL